MITIKFRSINSRFPKLDQLENKNFIKKLFFQVFKRVVSFSSVQKMNQSILRRSFAAFKPIPSFIANTSAKLHTFEHRIFENVRTLLNLLSIP